MKICTSYSAFVLLTIGSGERRNGFGNFFKQSNICKSYKIKIIICLLSCRRASKSLIKIRFLVTFFSVLYVTLRYVTLRYVALHFVP
jgi:hypothetical protein